MSSLRNNGPRGGLDNTDTPRPVEHPDDALLDAARAHEDYVTGETLATSISYDGADAGSTASIDGRELRISVARA